MTLARPAQLLTVMLIAVLAWHDWQTTRVAMPQRSSVPSVAPAAPPREMASLADLPDYPLFGASAPEAAGGAASLSVDAEALPTSNASYKLYGVLLAPGTEGRFALIGEGEGTQRAYREGESAPDGARVASVTARWVVLERNGVEERLPLSDITGTGVAGADGLPATEGVAVEPQAAVPTTNPGGLSPSARLQARLQARRAAAQPAAVGPKTD